ncbi:MAG: sigma-70 family RNA polymerase sigma factor [Lachnospiraceae bacterium]|nr:sigma-70 family RNA polymerase sigma factor [Lachnospiraceae bacterium]
MKCYHCQSDIPDGSKFCTFCGQAQGFDRRLIDAAAAGDNQAVAELYNRTYSSVYHTVKFLIKDEDTALDIVQDSYLGAFRHLSQLQDAEKFGPWMKRIAHNRAVDYLRRAKPVMFSEMVPEDSEEAVDFADDRPENSPDMVIDRQETARLLGEILDSLPEDQRACVTMFYYEQLSVKEIAQELEIPEATVKSRLQYGRNKIESQVRALERKGTKLYGFAPIPLLLVLLRSYSVQAAEIPSGQILYSVLSGLASGTAAAGASAGAAGTVGAVSASAGAVGTAAGTAGTAAAAGTAHAAGAGLGVKITAIIAAVVLIGGGGAAAWKGVTVLRERRETAQESAMAGSNGSYGNPSGNGAESVEIISAAETPAPASEAPALTQSPAAPEPTQIPTPLATETPAPTQLPAGEEPVLGAHMGEDIYSEYLYVVGVYIDRINTFQADPDAFLERYNNGYYNDLNNGINYYLFYEYFNFGGEICFAFNDLNLDGTPELVLGIRNTDRGDNTVHTTEAYTFNGLGAKQLFHDFDLGAHSFFVVLLGDGKMKIQAVNIGMSDTVTVCRIADDRNGLEIIEEFTYDHGDGTYHGNKGTVLDEADFDIQYASDTPPVYEDIPSYPVSEEGIQEYLNSSP